MCIVIEEADVCGTNIFVAPDCKKERQIVVYSNNVSTNFKKNLMILAVPNPETVDFLDMSEYKDFFEDVENYYKRHKIRTTNYNFETNGKSLYVYETEYFSSCICMNIDDLKKLDTKTFGEINDHAFNFIESKYSNYKYGFIVCKLKKGNFNYHPFAYTHKINDNKLFIPTMHYHGDEKYRLNIDSFKKFKLSYEWDHNIFVVNNQHDSKYSKELDKKMFKCGINFDIGPIDSISKIKKIGLYQNGDILISVKS